MSTDYEALYQQQRHALGEPTQAFVEFFDRYDKTGAEVLDLGCGQGRDALFIARQGHHVIGVDLSSTGIAQLLEDAEAESLAVRGVVADLRDYQPTVDFDVVLIDRTLHMLDAESRLAVLARACRATRAGGYLLIADEPTNLPAMRTLLDNDRDVWAMLQDKRGFLFLRKARSI